jgi:hypothetical protein
MAFSNIGGGGADSATITTANSDDNAAGTAASTVSIDTGTTPDCQLIYSDSATLFGGRTGFRMVHEASGTTANRLVFPNGSAVAGRWEMTFAFKVNTVSSGQIEDLAQIRHSAGNTCSLIIASDGKLQIANAAGTAIAASKATTALTANNWYWVSFIRTKGTDTVTGTVGYEYWDLGTAGYPSVQSYESSVQNAGTADTTHGCIGRATGRTAAHTVDYGSGSVAGDAKASGFTGPPAEAVVVTNTDNVFVVVTSGGSPPYTFDQTGGPTTTPTQVGATDTWLIEKNSTSTLTYIVEDSLANVTDAFNVPPVASGSSPVWPKKAKSDLSGWE